MTSFCMGELWAAERGSRGVRVLREQAKQNPMKDGQDKISREYWPDTLGKRLN